MTGQTERSLEELYRDDPERADALVFGRVTEPSRRGFLNGAGLAAMGAALGGAVPFAANMPGGLISAAMAQGAPAASPPAAPAKKGPTYVSFPGKSDKLVAVIGERPLVAETPESLLDDDTTPIEKFYIRNNGQIPEESERGGQVEVHGRRRGEQEARTDGRRAEVEVQTADAPLRAGMRWQRPLVLLPARKRQSVDERRRRLRRVDRRAARRRAEDGRR